MRKLTLDEGGIEVEQAPPAVFERRPTRTGAPRLVAWVADGKADLLRRLSALLPAPVYVLYVLHTPRGEGEPGRYQSPELTREDLEALLETYQGLFADDGRHDLWVYSPGSGQTLVWDRHNMLFAEGEPLDGLAAALVQRGYREGALRPLGDHLHHYRPEYDADAASLLAALDWYRTPLRDEDVQ